MRNPTPIPSDDAAEGTVIALHSSASSGGQWRAYAQAVPPDVTLHTPDLLGYGAGAAWPPAVALSLDDEAQALQPLLSRVPYPVHLVGHSYGGAVALQVALRWPSRVRSLTLYEPVRFGLLRTAAPAEWGEIRAVAAEVGRRVREASCDRAAERFVDYWDRAGSFGALSAVAQQRIVMRMPKVSAEFDALFADRLPTTALEALRLPVRILVGTRSPAPAQRAAEILATVCPGATLVRLAGAGHLAPINDPERVLPCLPFTGHARRPLAA